MRRVSFILVLAHVLTAGACRHEPVATSVGAAGGVTAAKVESGIRLTNHSGRGVAYGITNPMWLGLLAICNDPGPGCIRLAPGKSVVVPFSEIGGYESDTDKVTIYWWHVTETAEGQYSASDPVEIIIKL